MSEHPQLTEIDIKYGVYALTYTTNGEYLAGGVEKDVRVWRVKDGKQVATLPTKCIVRCVAVSRDGKWIAAGSMDWQSLDELSVWDATTYKQVFEHRADIWDVDFSPNTPQLLSACNCTATIWDIPQGQQVQTFDHNSGWVVLAAKYSPHGDRIATATLESVRIWDSNDGLLLEVNLVSITWSGFVLGWFNNSCFLVKTRDDLKTIDASSGSIVSQRPVPFKDDLCISLPQRGRFTAYCSANETTTLWDASLHIQCTHFSHGQDVNSIAISPDDLSLALGTDRGIIIQNLSCVTEPEILIDSTALDLWKNDQLTDVESLLTEDISTSDGSHHALASRAIVRARLRKLDEALSDANQSIETEPSVIGYIAKCVALVGMGKLREGCRTCDIACRIFRSTHIDILLLVKAIVLFLAGERDDAISRVDDLISVVFFNSGLYVLQAYMYLLLGNLQMEEGDYGDAIQSYEHARNELRNRTDQPPLVVILITGWNFNDLEVIIQQCLCQALYSAGRTKEAGDVVLYIRNQTWDFKSRCRNKLETRGDKAMDAKNYDEAISQYTAVLSLGPARPQDILVKRSKAHVRRERWEDALDDANEVIRLDPSSPWGYERKHEALRGAGSYEDSIIAFDTMLVKISESSDPRTRERVHGYVKPEQTKKIIRTTIQKAIRNIPHVLINAISGHLCNKSMQAAAFESAPAFTELISSMTTCFDHARIKKVVDEFYSYTTFSHTWEENEPLFQTVTKILVYDLEDFPTYDKLQMFCKIIRDAGFNWAWSDTCCIDKGDHFVLQEALVSMFKWYEGSAMTIIFLRGVGRRALRGALTKSLWNMRGWTLQEYHASKVVRFYTEDWTPYLGLDIYNHKNSPEIISEMEEATGISAQALMSLRPGLNAIREKLCLASTRETTRVEDAAYSLLGIFSITLPITYGEGDKALGRLLAELLNSCGDTSILAWTGESGSFNSCFPTSISVFSHPPTSHIPTAISNDKMRTITSGLCSLEFPSLLSLYDRLQGLPVPSVLGRRVRLPCITFNLGRASLSSLDGPKGVFRAQTNALGIVEIETEEDLSQFSCLCLVHPWIDFLLDRQPVQRTTSTEDVDDQSVEPGESSSFASSLDISLTVWDTETAQHISRVGPSSVHSQSVSLTPPLTWSSEEREVHILQFIARLRQPLGALLLTQNRRNVNEYRRVASESLIRVQVEEITPSTLEKLIDGVQMLDVL